MIRPFCEQDTEAVIRVWLDASLLAHSFLPVAYWEHAADDMRTLFLPLSDEVDVDDSTGTVEAFLAFTGEFLAALFVSPASQGRGVGSRLLRIARRMHPGLSLCVYAENVRAVSFYQRRGLTVTGERIEQRAGRKELLMEYVPPSCNISSAH